TLATMACSVPYAVGAAIAHPGRQVVCFTGDGGFTMLMGELATIVKYRLAMEGNPQYGVELQPIDFAAFARACGAGGYTVDNPTAVPNVLREAFHQQGPAVIEAVVD